MVLLSQEDLDRLRNQGTFKTVQTPGTPISRLDAELSDILYSPPNSKDDSDERKKCLEYLKILQRYLCFKDIEKKKNFDSEKLIETVQSDDSQTVEDIIESVPKKYKSATKQLLLRIKNAGNVTWDQFGNVSIDGVSIRGANMIDLVNDAARERKTRDPVPGRRQFALALRRAAIPREFIGNKKLWREILHSSLDCSSASSFLATSPTAVSHPEVFTSVSNQPLTARRSIDQHQFSTDHSEHYESTESIPRDDDGNAQNKRQQSRVRRQDAVVTKNISPKKRKQNSDEYFSTWMRYRN